MTSSQLGSRTLHSALVKVPQVTAFFWIIKVLATTVGETFADYLNSTLGFGLTKTTYVISALLVAILVIQFRKSTYVPWVYWLVVILISVAGTLVTDNLTDNFGVPLTTTTIIFSICLAITFVVWYKSEGTLSIHSVITRKREAFYWMAILFTFALGTASGDLVNEKFAIGYGKGLIVFGGLILLTSVGFRLGVNAVLSFWIAYILTRPLGASLGDLLTQPKIAEDGGFPGMGIDKYIINGVFAVVIVALVAYLQIAKPDVITEVDVTELGDIDASTI